MTTGMIRPDWAAVRALKFFTKSMILTPAWPSAGPTGGAGVAAPAGICSLTCPTTFLAIEYQPPREAAQIFCTCEKSSSTGVCRPKIVTITLSVLRSRLTSSTTPVKLLNGPSVIRTGSAFSNMYFGFGFSLAVTTCSRIC